MNAPTAERLIDVEDVSAGYGPRPVVSGVTFAAAAGEVVGLIGPNGAGKSTLLRALTRALPLRSGSVTLSGKPLRSYSSLQLATLLAFVPQSEPALFDFTVEEVVWMGRHALRSLKRSDASGDARAVRRALAAMDILHLADRRANAVSGGEHRRILIARALAQEAPILVLDEPTANLDISHEREVLETLHAVSQSANALVIAAMHDLNSAAAACSRLLLLVRGALAADGSPEQVLTPETLGAAYGASMLVARSPFYGTPLVSAQARTRGQSGRSRRVHVICGGGSGAATLSALWRQGAEVTAGVLNLLDGDQETAAALGIEHATEQPFSAIGPDAEAAGRALALKADALIVTEVAVGHGNVANLRIALAAAEAGTQVVLVNPGGFAERNFADEVAGALWRELVAASATADDATAACLLAIG